MSGPYGRGGAGNRALGYAILVSFAFHAALLVLVSLERQARRESSTPGPIVAHLVAARPAPAPPQPVAQPEPPKPRAEPKPPPPKPEAKPKPVVKPVPQPKPSPVPVPKSVEPTPAPPQAAPTQPAAPAAPPAPAAPAPAPSSAAPAPQASVEAPAGPTPSPDQGTLEAYRIDLMRMARNYKRYPRVAIDNNWEGRAVVRLVIGANGMTKALTIVTGSGHEVLDKQALDMIQKAKPRVQVPAALRGREFTIEIPVIYDLKDHGA